MCIRDRQHRLEPTADKRFQDFGYCRKQRDWSEVSLDRPRTLALWLFDTAITSADLQMEGTNPSRMEEALNIAASGSHRLVQNRAEANLGGRRVPEL